MAEKCPYCGEELEQGILWHRGSFFLPDGEKIPPIFSEKAMKKARAVELPVSEFSFRPDFPTAYICRKCRKITIPYREYYPF